MTEKQILAKIKNLDITSSLKQEEYWQEIKKTDINIPDYFLKAYPTFKKWQGRIHLVYHCVKYARNSDSAFQLGIIALNDKATLVRYRAASLLAYSLRKESIPYLEKNLLHPDLKTRKDAERAIRAIKEKNHYIFMEDRATKWIVNREIDHIPIDKNETKNGLFDKIKNLFKN
jgi:hypothetical protein